MNAKICCFTGHRSIPDDEIIRLPNAILSEIQKLYTLGVREFRTGGAIGFDTLAALSVIAFRDSHPDIRLDLILPCRDQESRWSEFDRKTYYHIIELADSVLYIENAYTLDCMHRRNRGLISDSDYCIAYVEKDDGGSAYTLKLAKKAGINIINLAPSKGDEQLKI